jgi:hypothetical protein
MYRQAIVVSRLISPDLLNSPHSSTDPRADREPGLAPRWASPGGAYDLNIANILISKMSLYITSVALVILITAVISRYSETASRLLVPGYWVIFARIQSVVEGEFFRRVASSIAYRAASKVSTARANQRRFELAPIIAELQGPA